jgi:hypothetical protein
MLLVATFSEPARAPAWARVLAFLFDDLKGSNTSDNCGPLPPPDTKSGSNGPLLRRTAAIAGVLGAALVAACTSPTPPKVPSDLANDYGCVEGDLSRGVTSFVQIEADCAPGQITTVIDIVDWILAKPERAQRFANVAPQLLAELRALRSDAAP